jgi:hypothetical protein
MYESVKSDVFYSYIYGHACLGPPAEMPPHFSCHHSHMQDRSIPLNINIITAKEIPTIPCVILGHIFFQSFCDTRSTCHRYNQTLHLYRTHAWCHVTQISNTCSPVASGNLFILPQLYYYFGYKAALASFSSCLNFLVSHQLLHRVLHEVFDTNKKTNYRIRQQTARQIY